MRVCPTALNDCTLFNAPIIIPVFLSYTMNNVQKKDKKIEMVVTRMVVNKMVGSNPTTTNTPHTTLFFYNKLSITVNNMYKPPYYNSYPPQYADKQLMR